MLPLILFSHGSFSKATKETAEMIVGNLEEVYVLSIETGSSISDVEEKLENLVKEYNGEVLILCDILGGTPSNITFKMKQKYSNILSYTGFNLPVVLELVFNRSGATEQIKELIETTFNSSLNEIQYVEKVENDSLDLDL